MFATTRLNSLILRQVALKTDSIFYKLFQVFPDSFFQLIGEAEKTSGEDYNFSSVEIKALSFRLDGVFLPKDEKSDHPINFVEVQFQRDDDIYYRFMTESFLYLGQTKPGREWQARLIFASKALDPGVPKEYEFLLGNGKLQIFHLRQMPKGDSPLLGIDVLRLVIATQKKALPQAQRLIERAGQEVSDPTDLKDIVGLIQDIIVYKFPKRSRKEIEAMFGLSDLRKTRYYQEVEADLRDEITTQVTDEVTAKVTAKVKLAPVSRLVSLGLSIQQIAQALEVDEDLIRSTLESAHSQS